MINATVAPAMLPHKPILFNDISSLGFPLAILRDIVSNIETPTPAGTPYFTRVINVPFQNARNPNYFHIFVAQTKHEGKSSISALNPAFTRILTVTSSAGHFNSDCTTLPNNSVLTKYFIG